MRGILKTLGWLRFVVSTVTVASLAVALHVVGIHPALNMCVDGLLALALVRAPYGARYRKNF